jgi:hypothetical protein
LASPQQICHQKERERTTNQKRLERSRSGEGEEKKGSVKKEKEIKINWLVCFSPFAGDSDHHRW